MDAYMNYVRAKKTVDECKILLENNNCKRTPEERKISREMKLLLDTSIAVCNELEKRMSPVDKEKYVHENRTR